MRLARLARNCFPAAFICVALAGFGGSSAVVPSSLLHALADSHYALPAGYTSAKSGVVNERGGNSVGAVTIQVQGPKQHGLRYNGIVYYTVFRSAADAQASVGKPIVGPTQTLHVIARSVPGFSSFPGYRFSGTVIGTNKAGQKTTLTSSEASIADGSVVVLVDTINAPQDEIPVLRSAVAHLQSAERLVTR
jgi:hypothetical protein